MYKKKKILVLGMGVSGRAVADYLIQEGAEITCVDRHAEELKKNSDFAAYPIFSENSNFEWDKIDFIVKSPGIFPEHPLLQKNKKVVSEIELACRHLESKGKILFAITGSNGKTTTTLLTTHILNACGFKALSVGNVGVPFLSQIQSDANVFVVELSSFQIEMLSFPIFHAGVILNITPNHLDRYTSFESYALAKMSLQRSMRTDGLLYVQSNALEQFRSSFFHPSVRSLPELHEKIETIFSLGYRDVKFFVGRHDFENLRAAYALCMYLGISERDVWEGFKTFQKPAHRIEFVGCVKGIYFVNDSKATSVDAVTKAVESMPGKTILIAGGMDKGGKFSDWVSQFQGKVRKVFAIGQAANRICEELMPKVPVEIFENLKSATMKAYEVAHYGETVLLSPGCSSYDQFRDYQERGEQFKQFVKELGEKQ